MGASQFLIDFFFFSVPTCPFFFGLWAYFFFLLDTSCRLVFGVH